MKYGVARALILALLAAMMMGCASSGQGDSADDGLFSATEPRLLPVAPEECSIPIHGTLDVSVSTGYRDLDRVSLAAN